MNSLSLTSNYPLLDFPAIPKFQPLNLLKSLQESSPLSIPQYKETLPSAASLSISPISRPTSLSSLSPVLSYSPLSPTTLSKDLTNLLMIWKLRQNLQTELCKQNLHKLLERDTLTLEKKYLQGQARAVPPFPANSTQNKMLGSQFTIAKRLENRQNHHRSIQKKSLRGQIRGIVNFVLENFGKMDEALFEKERIKYNENEDLLTVFDILTSKYASTIKTKEEMVKYTLRRAFKFMKNKAKKESNASNRGACKTLCNKYFDASEEEISQAGNGEVLLKVLLPFRKNSKNKTMNLNFIQEIFSSEVFCKDYEDYLEHFESLLVTDNKAKVEKLVSVIDDNILNNKPQDIKNYKRIPWPQVWITNTKAIAKNLPKLGNQNTDGDADKDNKRCNLEGQQVPSEGTESDCCSQTSTNLNS